MSEHSHTHVHEHGHEHKPAVDHGHSHAHHDGDSYFTDQLCMVGLSGAFGMICLCLSFWQTEMLKNMLAEQFHVYVLLSGIVLIVIAFARGAILWRQSRDPAFLHAHDHDHDHGHDHTHEHHVKEGPPHHLAVTAAPEHVHGAACEHDHKPGEAGGHDHAQHAHAHPHALDHDEADHDHGWAPWRYVVILVPIILFLLGLPDAPPKLAELGVQHVALDYKQLILDFTAIIYEALPFIVLGVLIAGLLEEFVPQQAIAKIVPRNHVLAIMIGALLGLVFPMCECGIIVVMKRLLRKGLPLSVCVAYMLAGPVINAVVMASTYFAFSGYNDPGKNDVLGGTWNVVACRVGLSYLVACGTALVVEWQWRRYGNSLLHPSILRGLRTTPADESNGIAQRPWSERINNITQTALHDFVDIMAFLVLGAILAAGGKFAIKATNVQDFLQQTPALAILMMMGIAILFCLCSEADAFVAANFPLFWPDGSKLAFLVLGPMLDLKLLLMYTRVFRARLIYTIVACLLVQVFSYTMVVEYFFGKEHPRELPTVILSPDQEAYLVSIGLGAADPYAQLVHWGAALNPPPSGKGEFVDFKLLESIASNKELHKSWKDKIVEVRGQYAPYPNNKQLFMLMRLKIQCCASDVTTLQVPMISREEITAFRHEAWVSVTGRVEIRERGNGTHMIVVIVSSASDVVGCPPDTTSPYIR